MDLLSRVMRFVGLTLAAAAVCGVVVLVIVSVRASMRLQWRLAPLRTAGQPLALAELARESLPPEANAATYLRRAQSELILIEREVTAAIEATPQADQDAFYQHQGGRASPAIMDAIRSAVADYPDVYPLLEQAARCPDYDPQVNYNVAALSFFDELPVEIPRAAIRYLNYRILAQLADGRNREAFDTSLVMFGLCKHFDRNPMILSFQVGAAMRSTSIEAANRALRAGPLPDSAYEKLEAELTKHDVVAAYRQALQSERALGVQSFGEIRDGSIATRVFPAIFNNDQADYLDLIELLVATADQPYCDSDSRAQASTKAAAAGSLTQLFAPAAQATFDSKCRVQAQLRCLRILNAILRREQAGNPDEPKLAELGLPADALVDPYSGESLLMRRLPEGWVVYSVGRKLTDGGGTNLGGDSDQDVGVGPAPTTIPATVESERVE